MTLSMIIMQDEATEENPKPKKQKHHSLVVTQELGHVGESDLKMLELELNVFELNDASKKVEKLRENMELVTAEFVKDQRRPASIGMLVNIAYAQEIWVQLARSISVVEEELSTLSSITAHALRIMIGQTRKDIKNLLKALQFVEDRVPVITEFDSETGNDEILNIEKELPDWIQSVYIDVGELQREFDCQLYQGEIDESQRFIDSFVQKANLDACERQTMQGGARPSIMNGGRSSILSQADKAPRVRSTILGEEIGENRNMDTVTKFNAFFNEFLMTSTEKSPLNEIQPEMNFEQAVEAAEPRKTLTMLIPRQSGATEKDIIGEAQESEEGDELDFEVQACY